MYGEKFDTAGNESNGFEARAKCEMPIRPFVPLGQGNYVRRGTIFEVSGQPSEKLPSDDK